MNFLKKHLRQIISILSVIVIGFSSMMAGMLFSVKRACADNEDVVISPDGSYKAFLVNGNEYATLFYKCEDGQVIYCTEHDYTGPTSPEEYVYSSTQPSLTAQAQQGLKCILSYGYIGHGNERVISEFSLTEEQARAATQTAIHMYLCDMKEIGSGYSYNYSGSFSEKPGEENTWKAMKWLYEKAVNNDENKTEADISVKSLGGERDGLYYVAKFEVNNEDYEYRVSGLAEGSYTTERNGKIIIVRALYKSNFNNGITVDVNSTKTSRSYNVGYYLSKNGIKQTMVGGSIEQKNPNDKIMQPLTGTYDEYGWLKIVKKDSQTGELLNNAVFYVYKDADCSGEPIAMLSSGRSYETSDNYQITEGTAQIPLDTGTYYVKEASAPYGYEKNNKILRADIVYNEVTELVCLNNPATDVPFSIVKRSAEDNDKVMGATYSLYDVTSVYTGTEEELSDWVIKTAEEIRKGNVTSSEYGFIQSATTNENGIATFDKAKMAGRENNLIMMIETHAPEGYQTDPDIYMLYLSGTEWKIADSDVMGNTVTDYYAPGKIKIKKVNPEGEALSGAVYGIYTDKNCTVPAHYVKGYEEYGYYKTDRNGDIYYEPEDAVLTTGADGTSESGYLVSGTYYIKEITAPAGYSLSSEVKSAYTGYIYDTPVITFVNERIKGVIEVHKTDATNSSKDVEGAIYGLYSGGQLYKTFPATNEQGYSKLLNLPVGNYTVKELSAPSGYQLNNLSYSVEINEGGNNIQYVLIETSDEPVDMTEDMITVKMSKTDQFGNYVKGAKLQLINSDDKVVDEWVTDDAVVHTYKQLIKGSFTIKDRTFTLREKETPDGYMKADDITFTVDDISKTATINMTDVTETGIYVEKVDENGNNVKGAVLQLKNVNGDIIDEWTSDGTLHYFDYEAYLKLKKGTADLSKIKLTDDDFIFTLHEEKTPENYLTADDITFNVNQDSYTAVVKMVDVKRKTSVLAVKINEDGEHIAGATLEVTDINGKICDTWISDGGAHVITGIKQGQTYTLHEAKAPYGYELAKDIYFTVTDGADNQTVTMTDKKTPDIKTCKIYVYKEDEYGTPLENAVLGLFDSHGNELFRWTTTKEAYVIDNLPVDENFTIQEISAPEGYEVAENISFTTKEDDVTIHVVDNTKKREIVQTGENITVKIIVYICIIILGICALIFSIDWKKISK